MRFRTDEFELDLLDLLTAEHRALADLLERIADLWDRTCYVEVADHFAVFGVCFGLHSEAEDEAIYAVLADGPPALEALIRDAEHHHALALTHTDQLSRVDVSLPEWRAHFDALVELIQYHAEMEESALRSVPSDELTEALSAELARDYLETKERLANPVDGVLAAGHER